MEDKAAWRVIVGLAKRSPGYPRARRDRPRRRGRGLQWGAMADRSRPGGDTEVVVPKTRSEKQTKRPTLWRVLLHNDDYTTQEFVDWVLMTVFHHDPESAHRIMLHVHMHGVGVAGIYPYEVAETKAQKTMALAREAEYPLLVTVEPE
jgi:ATP-dependent Clp protease adaptor protein ClpS